MTGRQSGAGLRKGFCVVSRRPSPLFHLDHVYPDQRQQDIDVGQLDRDDLTLHTSVLVPWYRGSIARATYNTTKLFTTSTLSDPQPLSNDILIKCSYVQ
jgi:hypothetical protein